jgi:hypothetical protein
MALDLPEGNPMRSYQLPEIRTHFLALAHKKPHAEESAHFFFRRPLKTNNIVFVDRFGTVTCMHIVSYNYHLL